MAVTSQNSAFFVQKLLEKALLFSIIFENWKHINLKNNNDRLKYK
jgi:hypothetical protein